jgi:ArsR family transcriptional regulator
MGMAKKHKTLSPQTMQMVAERFKVMSDPMRLQILNCLQEGELSVTAIVDKTDASQPNISKHLKILQNSGIVDRRREGNLVLYQIADESIFVLCDLVCGSIERRLKRQTESFAAV